MLTIRRYVRRARRGALSAALRRYAGDPLVMSVTTWTRPATIPGGLDGSPNFDGKAGCWARGTWRRA